MLEAIVVMASIRQEDSVIKMIVSRIDTVFSDFLSAVDSF